MAIGPFEGKYRFLSNFWEVEVVLDGVAYPSVENAYQAAKTTYLKERKPFTTLTPAQAKKAGKWVTLRPDWNDCKLNIMEDLCYQKYNTDTRCKKALLATGDEELVELNYWHDNFWGDCTCSRCSGIKGKNWLGKILMKLRTNIRKQKIRVTAREENKMKKVCAIVGTRSPSKEQYDIIATAAYWLCSQGWMVVTGGAQGVDQAAMEGALLYCRDKKKKLSDYLTVYLPWDSYNTKNDDNNKNIVPNHANIIVGNWDKEDYRLAELHPSWDRLTQGARKMMLRNAQICRLGYFAIVCPSYKNGAPAGGTAHGIQCLKNLGKTYFDITTEEGMSRVSSKIGSIIARDKVKEG